MYDSAQRHVFWEITSTRETEEIINMYLSNGKLRLLLGRSLKKKKDLGAHPVIT